MQPWCPPPFFADAPAAAPAVTPAVAQIGDTTYPGLQRAVNAAQAGATITLLSDIHETVFIPKDARITLDLNGKTVSTEEAPVLVVEGGSLTVRDSSAENFHPNKNADGTYSVHTHQFGPWVTTVEPGPATQGKQVQTCSVCGYEMAKTLPPTGNSGQPQKDPAKPDPAPAKPTPAPAKPTPAPAAKPAPAATPAPAANAPAAAGKAAVTVPQTSDDMPLGLLGGIAAAAAAAVALLILRKRRGV